MKLGFLTAGLLFLALGAAQAQPEGMPSGIKIKPKSRPGRASSQVERRESLMTPDTEIVDAPTAVVVDHMGYSARTRFFAQGGMLEHVSFGVFPNLNLGASFNIDGLIGNDTDVRVRAPDIQVKYRFYEGDRYIPAFAMGFEGQGFLYSSLDKRYNQRQRGFYIVASQELGLPGLQLHPSINISDFDTNSIFAAFPLTYNIRDKAVVLAEWDNAVGTVKNSRLNAGLRAFITPRLNLDFLVRSIGQGGTYSDGSNRGPERVMQLKYTGSF